MALSAKPLSLADLPAAVWQAHALATPIVQVQPTGDALLAAQLPGGDADLDDWLFFDDAGLPLKMQRAAGETAFLRPWASCASCSLPQILHEVHRVQGSAPLDTLEGVSRHIGL